MIETKNPGIDPDEAHKTLLIIWFALLMSQFLFVLLLYFIKPELFPFDLTKPLLDAKNFILCHCGSDSLDLEPCRLICAQQAVSGTGRGGQSIPLVQMALIVGCMLSHSITLFGFLLAFVYDYQYFFLWFILGIGATILHFPSRKYIDAATYKSISSPH